MGRRVTTLIILVVLISVGYIYFSEGHDKDMVYVVSRVDGDNYLVRDLPDKQEACDMLATIKQNMLLLVNHLLKNYPKDQNIKRLRQKFDPTKISEVAKGEKHTSYTVNKGEKIVLCLRARDKYEKLEKRNTMMFVSLHELAHVMSRSIGHDSDEFWRNFKFILKNAQEIGIYQNIDYSQEPERYCGMMITDSPMNDASIKI